MGSSRMHRRAFVSALGSIGLASAFAQTVDAQTPAPPRNVRIGNEPASSPTAGRPVLTQSDFKLLGYYDVQTADANSAYAQGLTHRYVNGDFRLLNWQLGDQLHEISLAGHELGSRIAAPTRTWSN